MADGRLRFVPAASVSLAEFAEAFTEGFSGYAIPLEVDAPKLSRRVRVDDYDLQHSLVAYDGDERVGMVALAIRGRAGWCGGLGVVPERRGRGVGRLLMRALLERASAAGLRTLSLEVLTSNAPARRLYEGAGMRVVRELLVLERFESQETEPLAREGVALEEAEASELLPHFTRLHALAPAWQRDLPSLLVGFTRGLRLGPRESPRAYALLSEGLDGKTYLPDLAAGDAAAARELSAGLACVGGALGIVNEPEQSLFVAPLLERGFAETARQHEMTIELR